MSGSRGAERASAISFRQLRLFTMVGDLRSARRASEECGLSQPAVTQALSKFEQQVGARLIDRRASGSYLNELGSIFHARAVRCFAQIEQALAESGAAASREAARSVSNRLTRTQLRVLIGVVEHGSFERAAEALDLSVSSLHRAARGLESNLRVSLFYRTAAGMLVSPAGAVFGRRMKLALQEIELGIDEVEVAGGGTSRPIVIGAMPFGGSVLLASALDNLLALHPRADIRIINDTAPAMGRSLRDGNVDLVVGLLHEREEDEEVVALPLAPTPYSVVARRGHALMRRGKVELADLAGCDWVVGTRGSSRRACFEQMFPHGAKPRTQIETCALTVLHHLLRSSDRLTLMTSYELEHSDDALRAIPFGPISPVPSIGITMRAGWLPTRLHADFIEIVRTKAAAAAAPMRQAG
ncbi:LysR family transcriptional regulator [Roseomonas elaeocarpi]|uniref:LysR family transcriptional regulator n=1 Tax=Roseomonas elaeocarpi TaxID=907779 RepID=A0ABV6JNP3_9PROT